MKRITAWGKRCRGWFKEEKVCLIKPKKGRLNIGAGVKYRGREYITNTDLPSEMLALVTFVGWQKLFLLSFLGLMILGVVFVTKWAFIFIVALLSILYLLDLVFTLYVLVKSLRKPPEIEISLGDIADIDDKNLPVYSILCPLYRESEVLGQFVENIRQLDWPKSKLDVLLLLEENDRETIEAAEKMGLPEYFRVIIVPQSFPKTKPKACNYGLNMARGEYVVIYDAEDDPDPLQLKKAYLAFEKSGDEVLCLQSKLNYYNTDFNLLTRLFTAEYSLWFDVVLPGLQSIKTIIPLGGTSNHFKTEGLRKLHAWDPFNVTEDCDLGMRLFSAGYKTAIINSTTLEEANSNLRNWIRQRSRWIKGYFQTYFVHMRNPVEFIKIHGVHALIFQMVIGMRMTFMLVNPILWVATLSYFGLYKLVGPYIDEIYPSYVFYIAVSTLIFGNFIYLYNYMIGCAKREQWGLIKFVFLVPFYWLAMSWAAGIAVYQLIRKPHYWEKTKHGLHLKKEERRSIFQNISVIPDYAKRGAFGGGVFLVGAACISNFSNFLYNAYLGRVLSVEEFGLVALMGSFFSLSTLVTSALGATVTHKSAYVLGKVGSPVKDFWIKMRRRAVLAGLILALGWVLLTPVLKSYFNETRLFPFLLFSPVWLVGFLLAVDTGYLRGSLKFYVVGVLLLIDAVSRLGLTFLVVKLGYFDWVYAVVPVAVFISFLVAWLFARNIKANLLDYHKQSWLAFPKKFFMSSVLFKLVTIAFLGFDMVLVSHFLTAREVGKYALMTMGGKVIFFLGMLLIQFINPLVSKEEGSGSGSNKVFNRLFLLTAVVTAIGFVAIGMGGSITMPILFGEKARSILPYILTYTLGISCFTLATAVVAYHQARKDYLFPILGLFAALVEVVMLSFFHSNLLIVSEVFLLIGFFYLALVLLVHLFYPTFTAIPGNIKDLVDLIAGVLNGKPEIQGAFRILMLNWRDTKHMWAGGAEVYVHEIAKRWVKEGHKVTLFCGNDGRCARNEVVDGVWVVRRGGFYTVYLWAALYYIFRFRNKFDVVVESENGIAFFTPLYVRKPKIMIVHHVHQEVFRTYLKFPFSVIARMIESLVMPVVYTGQKIVTVSESSKKEIIKLGLTNKDDTEIVTPAVESVSFQKMRKTKYPSFVYVGRLKPYKNIEVAIEAFGKVYEKHDNARLVIAGEGECREFLEGVVRERGLTRAVTFLGRVSEKMKARVLAESWVALQPSSFEGWGITVIEANACGTPVVASRVNGLKDSVVDGRTGVLVPVKDVHKMAGVMIELIKNRKYLNYLSGCAYEWAGQFSWDRTARDFMKIIKTKLTENQEMTFVKEMTILRETL